jgi:hypothetical protein
MRAAEREDFAPLVKNFIRQPKTNMGATSAAIRARIAASTWSGNSCKNNCQELQ